MLSMFRFALLVLAMSFALPLRARADVNAQQVRESIDRAVDYLRRRQQADGRWPEWTAQPGGVSSLCTLSLLNAGVPPSDDSVQRALAYLRDIDPGKTYATSLQTMVFCLATPKRDIALIRRNVKWLIATQVDSGPGRGGWSYDKSAGATDNSNAQYALLALHEAERIGVEVPDKVWKNALDYWLAGQHPEGSWGYHAGQGGASGSMTCAGIGSVLIAADRLNEPDAKVRGNQIECCGSQERNNAVERGLEWLGRHFSINTNPGGSGWLLYYLYGMERVGRLSAQRFIGGHDWYREGADMLVRNQDGVAGFFRGVNAIEDQADIGTAFALLFLAKGRRPVVVAKLRHGGEDNWNNHRRDIANLTAYTETRWQRELTWQIIDVRSASADDLLEAPVIFLSGRQAPSITDAQAAVLREYINRGGFLFAEACCGGADFDPGFRALCKKMFPEPEHALRLLPPEHPIWQAEEPVQNVKPLWGVDVGCRTSIVYCPENLGCLWELSRVHRESVVPAQARAEVATANSIGINVLAYATNREVRYKLDHVAPRGDQQPDDPLERAKLRIAKLRHAGGWDAAPGALISLQRALSEELGMRVDLDRHDLTLADKNLFRYHLVFMHGRNDFALSTAERGQLRTFVERGGMLMADAVCGSEAFARAFQREMAAVFPEQPLKRIPLTHSIFGSSLGGFDVRMVRRRDPATAGGKGLQAKVHEVEADLQGVLVGDRYGVVFSPFDLSCALERHESLECRGYVREDAARLAINLVLYSLH